MNILVINGPNLNMLGLREPDIYGQQDYNFLQNSLEKFANNHNINLKCVQSNHEGVLIDFIQNAHPDFDAIIINAGAYTHYSYAIYDALKSIKIPSIEVHISNIYQREEFRHKSVIAPACIGQISGLGFQGYLLALQFFLSYKHYE